MIQTLTTVMQLFKGSYFSMSAVYELIRVSRTVQCTYFTTYELFHLLQSEV